jgi:hypothetical protein
MSYISLSTRENETIAYGTGADRAHFSFLAERMFVGLFDMDDPHNWEKIAPHVITDAYTDKRTALLNDIKGHFSARPALHIDGKPIDLFVAKLNTALSYGSDAMKLAARLHGQSELHCWVAGKNRVWLADIIENAPTTIFRVDVATGESYWKPIIESLRETDEGDAVFSYSVGSSFPLVEYDKKFLDSLSEMDDEDEEIEREAIYYSWAEKPYTERWDDTIDEFKEQTKTQMLELTPDNWDSYYFGRGPDALNILEKLGA